MSRARPDTRDVRRAEWRRLLAVAPYLRAHAPRVVLAMTFLIAAKGASVLLPIALKHIVDGLDRSEHSAAIVLPLGLLLAYGALRLASTLFGQIRDLVFGRVTERTMHQVALAVFSHLHALDLDFHLSRRTGGLSRDIERGLGGIRFLLRFMLFNILPTAFEIALVAAILVYYYSVWFSLIVLVSVVAYVGVTAALTEWRTRHVRESNRLDAAANTRAVDSLLNYETVKYFGNEEFEARRYDAELSRWAEAMARARRSLGLLNTLQALVVALGAVAVSYDAAPVAILLQDKAQRACGSKATVANCNTGLRQNGHRPFGLRAKIAPSCVAGLDRRATAAGAPRLVRHDFGSQRGAV